MKQKKYILQVDDYDTEPLAVFDTIEDAKKYIENIEPKAEFEWDSKVEDTADAYRLLESYRIAAYTVYPIDYFPSEV